MTFSGDPYRILGLAPGSSLDDVKRAYRRLAKRYHPDAAGPDAVARFLVIQGAYDAIAGPGSRSGRGPSTRRASAADPDRTRATRAAYRAWAGAGWGSADGQAGAGAPGGRAPGRGSTGEASSARPRRPGASQDRPRDPAPEDRPSAGESPRHESGPRRPSRRKATLRSTSYDDAAQEPRHPDWQGSRWYGTSSGTYWTINPREYADPRKHGPEYQARARRAAGGRTVDEARVADEARDEGIAAPGASRPLSEEAAPAGREADAAGSARDARPSGRRLAWERPARASRSGEPTQRDTIRSSAVQTAGSIGLASGLVAAVPAAIVALGSTMAGDAALAGLAVATPAVVALCAGLAVGLLRRQRR